jgi:hypothetical protein
MTTLQSPTGPLQLPWILRRSHLLALGLTDTMIRQMEESGQLRPIRAVRGIGKLGRRRYALSEVKTALRLP